VRLRAVVLDYPPRVLASVYVGLLGGRASTSDPEWSKVHTEEPGTVILRAAAGPALGLCRADGDEDQAAITGADLPGRVGRHRTVPAPWTMAYTSSAPSSVWSCRRHPLVLRISLRVTQPGVQGHQHTAVHSLS
jgi:hypothetical protein